MYHTNSSKRCVNYPCLGTYFNTFRNRYDPIHYQDQKSIKVYGVKQLFFVGENPCHVQRRNPLDRISFRYKIQSVRLTERNVTNKSYFNSLDLEMGLMPGCIPWAAE